MKKKPNIKIGIIINIVLSVLSIVYLFLYYIEKSGFELNYNSLEFFIFYIFYFIIGINLLFFLFYSFFYKWARIGLVITLLIAIYLYL